MRRLCLPLPPLAVALALALALGAAPSLAQDDASSSTEAVALMPVFPDRVVAGPAYNGGQEIVLDAIAAPFLVAQAGAALREAEPLLRQRSLRLGGEGGLIDAVRRDAEAKGWSIVPELTVDGTVLYHSLGLKRPDGSLLVVLAFGAAVAPRADQPGASLAIAEEAVSCPEGERIADFGPGLAPCPVAGFAPVWVWTNLPEEAVGPRPWLDPGAPALPDDAAAVWGEPATWESVLAGTD